MLSSSSWEVRNGIPLRSHIGLVASIARRYAASGMELQDIIGHGIIGLCTAADKFDPAKGRFSTYATWWIRREILRAIKEQSRAIRIPLYVWDDEERLAQAARVVASLDAPLEDGGMLADVLTDPDSDPYLRTAEAQEREELPQRVARLLACLRPREQAVIRLRFGFNGECLRLREIGAVLGLTPEGVRVIERRALGKLRASSLSRSGVTLPDCIAASSNGGSKRDSE